MNRGRRPGLLVVRAPRLPGFALTFSLALG